MRERRERLPGRWICWVCLVCLTLLLPRLSSAAKHTFQLDTRDWHDQPRSVHVAGTFNGWGMNATPMPKAGDKLYKVTLDLPEGVVHYKFVIDGNRWINDPRHSEAELEEDDGHGGKNSAALIGPDARKLPAAKPDAIEEKAILFDPASVSDVNVAGAGLVRFRIRVQTRDVQQAVVNVEDDRGVRTHELHPVGARMGYDAYGGMATVQGKPKGYWFTLYDGKAKALVTPRGVQTYAEGQSVPAQPSAFPLKAETSFETPDWSKQVVWYQIFPERFRNGEPSNDPGEKWFERLIAWNSDWWATQPGEAPGQENFFQGEGNVWKRRYGGDLQGVREKLPYLRSLGVTAIYFNPIFEAESMHKYDTADFRHVDDNFGVKGDLPIPGETDDPATWKWSKSDRLFLDFIQEAHRQGFKVVIDGVFNHVGRAHPLFQDVVKNGPQSRYADWFEIEAWPDELPAKEEQFGKPGGLRFKAWDGPSGHLPAFKKDPKLGLAKGPREHIFAITKRWLAPDGDPSKGIDGWRLDVPGDIPHPFWIEWRKLVKSTKPDAYITGEIWSWAQPWLQGDQFDAVMNYQFATTAVDFFVNRKTAIKPSQLADRIAQLTFNYPLQVALVNQNLFDSHDTDRIASMFVNPDRPYDGANRPQDNAKELGYDARQPTEQEWARFKQAVAFQMTMLGAPMIYYGDEAGMWSPDDPSNRMPFWWKDLEPFANPQFRFNDDVFSFYQRAIAVRHALPALRLGFVFPVKADDERGVFAFARQLEDKIVYVVINRSDAEQEVVLNVGSSGGEPAASGQTFVNWMDEGQVEIVPPGDTPDARPTAKRRNGAISAEDGVLKVRVKPYHTVVLSR